ncbi:phage portal protein [Demequina capsici]|uniref:Phage portal protein n=1 Tax=Demequina capsici TaxID=3075620 RepID=A0AA96F8Q1_9MICO|nr:phage portal protein [Demequina sp. OYTSA14]WNM25238.1 phage portal protein [Demequina sp. OYTSA14]
MGMGILDVLKLTPSSSLVNATAMVSPWTEGQLSTIVWSDVLGTDAVVPVTRAEAMRIPAVAKARNLIAATIMRLPLVAMRGGDRLPDADQPTWMYRTDGSVSPQMRNVWTIDDMLFYGASLWSVTRGADGTILTGERIPWDWWTITPDGAILVHNEAVKARDVLYFPSHTDPLLEAAATTIRAARDVNESVARRAASPVPVMEIHQNETDTPLSNDEAKALVTAYNAARRDPEGATVFTPSHITLNPHGDRADSGALTEARNASRLDIANHTGLPASMLEGTSAAASLTYVTTDGKRSELIEYGVLPWVTSFEARLSMDDVVARGLRSALDLDVLIATQQSATGAERQD